MQYTAGDNNYEQSLHNCMGYPARGCVIAGHVLQTLRQAMEAQQLAAGEAGGRPRSMPGASPMPPLRVKQETW